jgi:hypothetical protein
VYLKPEVACDIYDIARIVSIFETETMVIGVNVAWFKRSKDLQLHDGENYLGKAPSDGDCRHIYATMHTGCVHGSYLKGKCKVEHLDHISNIGDYRKEDDCFYYCQLYDEKMRTIYDIVPIREIRHISIAGIPYVIPFPYVFVESMRCVNVEEFRIPCDICHKWLGGNEQCIFRCTSCQWKVHKTCQSRPNANLVEGSENMCNLCASHLGPRQTWENGFETTDCNDLLDMKHDDKLEKECSGIECTNDLELYIGKIAPNVSMEAMAKLWPFRYLGMDMIHSEKIRDPNRIYPSTKTINDEQGIHPPCKEEGKEQKQQTTDEENSSCQRFNNFIWEQYWKGENSVIIDQEMMRTFIKWMKMAVPYFTDKVYQESLSILHHCDYDMKMAWKDIQEKQEFAVFDLISWSASEKELFHEAYLEYGKDFRAIKSRLPEKHLKDIQKYFYYQKTKDRYREFIYDPANQFNRMIIMEESDDEDAISLLDHQDYPMYVTKAILMLPGFDETIDLVCTSCYTLESSNWIMTIQQEILCGSCGNAYRKYGKPPLIPETIKLAHKATYDLKWLARRQPFPVSVSQVTTTTSASSLSDGEQPKKRRRRMNPKKDLVPLLTSASVLAEHDKELVDVDLVPRLCDICSQTASTETNGFLVCRSCALCVHQGCYGAFSTPTSTSETKWFCARCNNDHNPIATTRYDCVLCGQEGKGAIRRTTDNNWAHIVCALLIEEVKFGILSDGHSWESIEGIGNIPEAKWRAICSLCHQSTGACVLCSESGCSQFMHGLCAQQFGLQIEIHMIDNADDKGFLGDLRVFCAHHSNVVSSSPLSSSNTHDDGLLVKDLEAKGSDMFATQPTWLSFEIIPLFVQTYKKQRTIPMNSRLLSINLPSQCYCHIATSKPPNISPTTLIIPPSVPQHDGFSRKPNIICAQCQSNTTPYWWTEPLSGYKICHRCLATNASL